VLMPPVTEPRKRLKWGKEGEKRRESLINTGQRPSGGYLTEHAGESPESNLGGKGGTKEEGEENTNFPRGQGKKPSQSIDCCCSLRKKGDTRRGKGGRRKVNMMSVGVHERFLVFIAKG